MKRLYFIAFLILLCQNATAEDQFYFKHYGSEDGLPNNTITCSYQDHFGFIWFGTKDGICRFNGHSFTTVEDNRSASSCVNGMTLSMCEDQDGLLWCCSPYGVGNYNLYTGEISHIDELKGIRFNDVKVDGNNNVWLTSSSIIIKLDKKTGKLVRYSSDANFSVLHACVDANGTVLFTTYQGDIHRYNTTTDRFDIIPLDVDTFIDGTYPVYINAIDTSRVLVSTNLNDIIKIDLEKGSSQLLVHSAAPVRCLLARSSSEYLIGTRNRLIIYNDVSDSITYVDNSAEHSLSNNNITSLLRDNEGNIWLGTYFSGINLWHNRAHSFSKVFYTGAKGTFYGTLVHAITADKRGNLWVGTEDGELNKLTLSNRVSVRYSKSVGFPEKVNIHSMICDDNLLWLATFEDGLYFFDLQTERITKHVTLPSNQCVCLLKTTDNTIYVGTSSGLYKYKREDDSFEYVADVGRRFIHALYQDSYGTIWVGTYGSGIIYSIDGFDSVDSIQSEAIQITSTMHGIGSNYITCFYEDSSHVLWVGTEGGGLCKTKLDGPPSFTCITRNNGFPSNVACAIIQDDNGLLWVSTTKGLVLIDPSTDQILEVYLDNQGVIGNQYMYSSCYKLPTGRLAFGTTNGMVLVNPTNFQDPIKSASLYFQDIQTGKDGEISTQTAKYVVSSDKMRIKQADAAYLSITYTALYYANISVPKYEYTLTKGNRQTVSTVTTDNSVVFADMQPGKYHFDVKIVGSTSPESHKELSIIVVPPFYRSKLAYFFYALLISAVVIFFVIILIKKRDIEQKSKLEQMEGMKQKEIYDAKINFFTNITHEIRTPLSLIKMPIEKIIAQQEYTKASKDDIMTIKANTNRLLELTNQLLDLRKMEQNKVAPHFLKEDICSLVRKTCDYFAKAAQEQHIAYTVSIPEQPYMMMCSADMIKKIISNLLSNAVKYCKDSIQLTLTVDESKEHAVIRVSSNGELIQESDREKIFTAFYQVKPVSAQLKGSNGTGLGLPYARTLANLHKGTLILDTEETLFNSFVLTLPLNLPATLDLLDNDPNTIDDNYTESDADSNKHSILVVEDAAEMRHYLAKELTAEYIVFTASNGEEAVEIVKTQRVDLIVSDIMMPVMDGCQLCNFIKSDMEYSHIPVILLTAAVGVETRIETLEVGADGYIEKPFAMELLMANISNLFKNREISNKQFANSPLSHFNGVSSNNVEKAFMDKLHNAIMQHLAEQDLGIDTLTGILGTSKSTLYRKIKANTGLNTNEYIRLFRLKKAAEMLSSQEYRINEVAYLVGFSSPSYFTTSFQKQFNISPSAFMKNLKSKE